MHFLFPVDLTEERREKKPSDQTSTQTRMNQEIPNGVNNSKYRYVPS